MIDRSIVSPALVAVVDALLASSACSPNPLQLELPIRPGDVAAVLVVAIAAEDERFSIVATGASDLVPPDRTAGTFSVDASLLPNLPRVEGAQRLRAAFLSYPVPLADLALLPGPLPISEEASAVPLPAGARVHAIDLAGDGDPPAPWPESSERPRWLNEVLIAPAPCADVEASSLRLNAPAEVVFIQRTVSRVVVGLSDGNMLNFSADLSLVQTDEFDDKTMVLTAVEARDGAYWFSSRDGWIYRASLGSGGTDHEQQITQAPSGGALAWMDGVFDRDRPEEIFTLTSSGAVEHYAGGQWTRVASRALVERGGVVRIGEGEALIAVGEPELLHVRGGTVAIERPSPTGAAITAIARVPGFAVIAGTSDGQALRYQENGWSVLGRAEVRGRIASILPYRRGFVAGTTRGELAELVRGRGFCAPMTVTTSTLSSGTEYEGALYAGGTRARGVSNNELVVLPAR
ncbi:MAG: hypothetical protein IT384_28190 [Deltaproteobacteria bacterium]|nr:hypothetical protein [Deltaproteobacteria bacterium]